MALAAIVDSLDGISDAFKGEYKEISDGDNKGKFILDVAGVSGYGLEHTDTLRANLGRTTADLASANAALQGYAGLKLKPSELATKMKRLDDLEKFDPETEADKRAATKLDGFKTQLTTEFEGKLAAEKSRGDRYYSQVEKHLVTAQLQSALAKHGGVAELLMPVLATRVKVQEDAEGNITHRVVDEFGNTDMTVRDGKAINSTVEDLVLKFKEDKTFGRAFEASGKTGSGAPPKNNGGHQSTGGQTYTQSEWLNKTSRAEPPERKQLFQDLAAGKITVTPNK